MKKIMFGNSLMLLGIALTVLAGLKISAIVLLVIGFVMAVIGFFSKDN